MDSQNQFDLPITTIYASLSLSCQHKSKLSIIRVIFNHLAQSCLSEGKVKGQSNKVLGVYWK